MRAGSPDIIATMSPRLGDWGASLFVCAFLVLSTGGGSKARARRARTEHAFSASDGAREWRLTGLRDEGGSINPLGPTRARRQLAESLSASVPTKSVDPVWIPRGPTNHGGRARALVIHPTLPGVMWAATG